MNKPKLNEGEIYVGSITGPDGIGHHFILLPGDYDGASWDEQMKLGKSLGGDLPDRDELSLLFKYLPEQFGKDWYWSNTQHAGDSGSAWSQNFDYGLQELTREYGKLRARFVRRVEIK